MTIKSGHMRPAADNEDLIGIKLNIEKDIEKLVCDLKDAEQKVSQIRFALKNNRERVGFLGEYLDDDEPSDGIKFLVDDINKVIIMPCLPTSRFVDGFTDSYQYGKRSYPPSHHMR